MLLSLILAWGLPAPTSQSLDAPCLVAAFERTDQEATLLVHLEGRQSGETGKGVWEQVDHLFLRGAGTQLNLHQPEPRVKGGHQVALPLSGPGVWLAGFDRAPRTVPVTPQDWADLLHSSLEVATRDGILARTVPERPVPVQLLDSGLCLVRPRVSSEAHAGGTATSKAGLRAELRLLADPMTWTQPSDLPLRAYANGDKVVGARVFAQHQDEEAVEQVLTNESGITHVRLHRGGAWRLWYFQVQPAPAEMAEPVEFLVYRSTYSLQLPEWR